MLLELAKQGGKKLLKALKKFLNDSALINEIDSRVDKEVFLPAVNTENYKHIEDIKENDIFEQFISRCFDNQTIGIDVNQFVEEYYSEKDLAAKIYIKSFYSQILNIIFEVIRDNSSPDAKVIIKGIEISTKILLDKFADIENKFIEEDRPDTIVVTYWANMQNVTWSIENSKDAVVDKKIIDRKDLTQTNNPYSPADGKLYWDSSQKSITAAFNKKVLPLIEEGKSISVFALAPIPLLVLLGNLLANRPNIQIYQQKKNPSSWSWEEPKSLLDVKTKWIQDNKESSDAILLISLSGKIKIDNINKVIDVCDKNIVEIYIDIPYDDCLRSKEQLDEFMTEFRKIKSMLNIKGVEHIHLFAAIPVAVAISIGQAYNPNYDADIITYDFKKGSYTKAIIVGEGK